MKIFILFFLIFNVSAYAYSYNKMLIQAQSSVFPKILLLDEKLDEKLVDNKVLFIIAYEEGDEETAIYIKELLLKRHKSHLHTHEFKIEIIEFSKISKDTKATAIYALNSKTNIKKLSEICALKGIISFAYDMNNLKHGFMFSLIIEKNTALYLNKKNLNNNMITFVESFYEIVKFTD